LSPAVLYSLAGAVLFCLGLYTVVTHANLIRKILAVNVMSAGVAMLLIAMARRAPDGMTDPVPHALVLTGIVVLVSATAFALSLACRVHAETGEAVLPPAGDGRTNRADSESEEENTAGH
jgi:multicomponent Na+:H+ antiporter subunit C